MNFFGLFLQLYEIEWNENAREEATSKHEKGGGWREKKRAAKNLKKNTDKWWPYGEEV